MPLHQKQAGLAASKLGVGTSKKHRAFVASDEQWYNKIFDPSSDFILT
jgi:cyclic nucleotide gated channel, plant